MTSGAPGAVTGHGRSRVKEEDGEEIGEGGWGWNGRIKEKDGGDGDGGGEGLRASQGEDDGGARREDGGPAQICST